jgi:hypothetical protein
MKKLFFIVTLVFSLSVSAQVKLSNGKDSLVISDTTNFIPMSYILELDKRMRATLTVNEYDKIKAVISEMVNAAASEYVTKRKRTN